MNNVIPVVMSFDENYLFPFLVTLFSLLTNAAENVKYELYILMDQNNTDLGREDLDNYKKQFPGFDYHYCYIDYSSFSWLSFYYDYITIAACGRLLIDQLVVEHDYCLYLDSDLLICDDLSSLYHSCINDSRMEYFCLAAAKDLSLQTGTDLYFSEHRKSIGFSDTDILKYFNSGVMIMNLKKFREDRLYEQFKQMISAKYMFVDQDILNIVCKDKSLYISNNYNYAAPWVNDSVLIERAAVSDEEKTVLKNGHPIVWHFSGTDKPWNNIETPEELLWKSYAVNMPVCTESMKERILYLDAIDTSASWRECAEPLRESGKLIIYGYTYISRKITDILLLDGVTNLTRYIDRNQEKWGENYRGISCTGFDFSDTDKNNASFLICAQTAWPEIYDMLTALGISEKRIFRYRLRDHRIIQRTQN